MRNKADRIVIVGAGLAGLRSAERLRELGFDGELVIIGAERTPPYHRPALSKQLLMGTMRPADLMLPAYRDVAAKWRLGTQVEYILPHTRQVKLPGGEEIHYDGLIIASGVEAKRPNDIPYHDPRVMVMRTLPDALDLERAIASSRGRVAVVGGGFTGCEIAASLRHMGREVTIIGRSPNLLGNVLGPALGEWLTSTHRGHGVDLALGTSVRHWQPGPEGIDLHLSDGSSLQAACVVLAAGTMPVTNWLRGSGLPLDDGVVCDPTCHVVGAEDIVAAGDVAQWPNLRFDGVPRRIEHWLNAVEMGRAAAESLMAGRSAAQPFTPMPRFWTEQYGIRIQAAGVPKLGTDTVKLGDDSTTVTGYVRDGKLVGVVGVDCPSSVLTWTDVICEQNPIPQRLTGAPAPAVVASAAEPRDRGPRHSLPAKQKASATSSRMSPADSHARMSPVQALERPHPADLGRWPGLMDSTGRIPPVGTEGRLRPVDSSGRIPPVTSGRMRPVDLPPAAPVNGRPGGPAESNGRMRPVPPPPPARNARPAPLPTNGRMVPAQGSGPADSNGRMRPVPPAPPAMNGRSGPLPTNGRMVPVNGRPGPADSNGRMRPVPPPTNGRMVPAQGGRPSDSNGRMRPVPPPAANARPRPVEMNGRFGPADSNPRMRPVPPPPPPVNGRPGPADSNGRMRPVPPPTNGRIIPAPGNGPEDSHGRLRPLAIVTCDW